MLYVERGALRVLCLACGFSLALREDCERVCNPEIMMVVKFGAESFVLKEEAIRNLYISSTRRR